MAPDGAVHHTTRKNGRQLDSVEVQLTNFAATIAAETTIDNGAETRKELTIETQFHGRQKTLRVRAPNSAP